MEAASALANLARDNEDTQTMIFKAGGIGPLLALLPARSVQAQARGAEALAQLARCARARAAAQRSMVRGA